MSDSMIQYLQRQATVLHDKLFWWTGLDPCLKLIGLKENLSFLPSFLLSAVRLFYGYYDTTSFIHMSISFPFNFYIYPFSFQN